MKLNPDDQVWCPVHHPQYLCLLKPGQRPPDNRERFLDLQENLLERLLAQAAPEEVRGANRRLERDLPVEALDQLPNGLLTNPQTPNSLFQNPMVLGSPLHQWKVDFKYLKNPPLLPQPEAREQAEQLSLESYLSHLL